MNNEIYHYGIKGMKWGIRRYQNKDGSYTTLGLKRYQDKYANKAQRQAQKNINNANALKETLKSGEYAGLKLNSSDRKAAKQEMDRSIEAAKAWLKTRDDILNMKVDDLTKKNIKNRFKNSGSPIYYPFA